MELQNEREDISQSGYVKQWLDWNKNPKNDYNGRSPPNFSEKVIKQIARECYAEFEACADTDELTESINIYENILSRVKELPFDLYSLKQLDDKFKLPDRFHGGELAKMNEWYNENKVRKIKTAQDEADDKEVRNIMETFELPYKNELLDLLLYAHYKPKSERAKLLEMYDRKFDKALPKKLDLKALRKLFSPEELAAYDAELGKNPEDLEFEPTEGLLDILGYGLLSVHLEGEKLSESEDSGSDEDCPFTDILSHKVVSNSRGDVTTQYQAAKANVKWVSKVDFAKICPDLVKQFENQQEMTQCVGDQLYAKIIGEKKKNNQTLLNVVAYEVKWVSERELKEMCPDLLELYQESQCEIVEIVGHKEKKGQLIYKVKYRDEKAKEMGVDEFDDSCREILSAYNKVHGLADVFEEEVDDDSSGEVEQCPIAQILDHEITDNGKTIRFLVSWEEGYGEDSWELKRDIIGQKGKENAMCLALLNRYMEENNVLNEQAEAKQNNQANTKTTLMKFVERFETLAENDQRMQELYECFVSGFKASSELKALMKAAQGIEDIDEDDSDSDVEDAQESPKSPKSPPKIQAKAERLTPTEENDWKAMTKKDLEELCQRKKIKGYTGKDPVTQKPRTKDQLLQFCRDKL